MKEQLYTIPLNDAVNAGDECPFCFIERSIEQDLLDFVLGSSSSYMEADIREMTDKAGFCRDHFKKMFDYGNTLGNAWILKTHYQRMIGEMHKTFSGFRPGKPSLKDKFKKAEAGGNAISSWVREKEASCYICSHYRDTYERYLDTFGSRTTASGKRSKTEKASACPISAICARLPTPVCPAGIRKISTPPFFPSWNRT